jgi:hypothetical protein
MALSLAPRIYPVPGRGPKWGLLPIDVSVADPIDCHPQEGQTQDYRAVHLLRLLFVCSDQEGSVFDACFLAMYDAALRFSQI